MLAYDAVGNLLTVADLNGVMTFADDALNRKTSEQGLFGQVLTNVYDAVGNRTFREDNHAGFVVPQTVVEATAEHPFYARARAGRRWPTSLAINA